MQLYERQLIVLSSKLNYLQWNMLLSERDPSSVQEDLHVNHFPSPSPCVKLMLFAEQYHYYRALPVLSPLPLAPMHF